MNIDAVTLFRMLADPTRLRILMLLTAEGELCVCELTCALGLSQPKISRHLAHLRESSLLLSHRAGQWMYYRINSSLPDWAESILQQTLAGNRNNQPFAGDRHGLADMPDRPGAACCA
jgi:ArsR family transcriptional regulator